ncbi:CatB-related O-acetyltransferase [Paragemmobacter ruber]|uniref:Antibiotic acetyltransferase n=1 Tax=Paragemmobacter ruber TaxID=1985673 RepID=A0ABW9YAS8_9RHOB|nr:CatB-related O-acetyltransferase [Rhodobacter ruber]NBE09653.1 antibiotic acetyltransferase [Rhodobacter ruber]
MPFLDADAVHPLTFPDGTVHRDMVHLSRVIVHPNITVGDYSYANDFDPPAPDGWAARLAPYLYPGAPERLILGRFCQIAHGVRFITASANHAMGGITTYPFGVFDPDTLEAFKAGFEALPDTVIGHDVWIGHGALILPGAQIGSGAIIGASAVVAGDVPPYAIAAGNPARVIRHRFRAEEVARLLQIAWWDWPPARIRAALPALLAGDVAALERC